MGNCRGYTTETYFSTFGELPMSISLFVDKQYVITEGANVLLKTSQLIVLFPVTGLFSEL